MEKNKVREKEAKKQLLGDSEFSAISVNQDEVKAWSYKFNPEELAIKPMNPVLFDNFLEVYKQEDEDVFSSGGDSSVGSLPGGTIDTGSAGGVKATGALSLLGCAEGEGQVVGGNAGGDNPAGMPSEQGGSYGLDDAPDMDPSGLFEGNPMEGCGPGFNMVNLPGSVATPPEGSDVVIAKRADLENTFDTEEIKSLPLLREGGLLSNIVVPENQPLGDFDTKIVNKEIAENWKEIQNPPPGMNAPKTYMVKYTFHFYDPEGDSGNANNCGPGFFSFISNLDCGDSDEDCEDSDKGMVSFVAPSPMRYPRTPAMAEMTAASNRTIRITWLFLKPIAMKTPNSDVLSRTLPIIVTRTTRPPTSITSRESP